MRRGSSAKKNDAPLLHNVPLSDLKYFEEFAEGDYIVYQQKLGFVLEVVRDVILSPSNEAAVSLEDPLSLDHPLSTGPKDVISRPSHEGAVKSRILENGETVLSLEAPDFYPGDFLLTSKHNLRVGDWISGAYSDSTRPGGHVVATPASSIRVAWLCPNTFAPGEPYHGRDSDVFRPATLQRHAVKCDFGKLPADSNDDTLKADSWLGISDKVRFRDPAKAASKYSEYQHIPADQTFGHDLNIFRIVSMKSEFTVRWQDLSITIEDASSLHRFAASREEFWPGNLVTLREEIETTAMPRGAGHGPPSGRFEGCQCHMLRPKNVGVIQAVDSRDRIASVRWYKKPDVRLLHCGSMWGPSSVFGELCDETTDVSLYELTTFPGLNRALDDLVLLTPEKIHQSVMTPANPSRDPAVAGPCQLSMLSPLTFPKVCAFLEYIRNAVVGMDWFKDSTEIDSSPLPPRHSIQRQQIGVKVPADFVGRIMSTDIDGTITVRLMALDKCRDIRVPLGKILMVVDFEHALFPLALPGMDDIDVLSPFGPVGGIGPVPPIPELDDPSIGYLDDELADRRSGGAIAPDIEHRLDDDSDDGLWITDSEYDEDEDMLDEDDVLNGHDMLDGRADDVANGPEVAEIQHPHGADSDEDEDIPKSKAQAGGENTELPKSSFNQPLSCPDSFMILDGDPPSDHRFLSTPASEASGVRIRRIRKEYEILTSSLPLGIFVRSWESRLDLFRVLIIGAQGTPYEYAPFVIDFRFPSDYPNVPPESFFHSWTNGLGMINPNLYEDGKICLSILGTWPGKDADEIWSPIKSTVLQVLVSIMGLVLVKTPFYSMSLDSFFQRHLLTRADEAGFEELAAEGGKQVESGQYTEKAFLLSRTFIKHALCKPVAGFEDVLAWNYLAGPAKGDKVERPRLLRVAIESALAMIEHHNNTSGKATEESAASPFVFRLSLGAVVMLRKHVAGLEEVESDSVTEIS